MLIADKTLRHMKENVLSKYRPQKLLQTFVEARLWNPVILCNNAGMYVFTTEAYRTMRKEPIPVTAVRIIGN